MGKTLAELERLVLAVAKAQQPVPVTPLIEDILRLLKAMDMAGLEQLLEDDLARNGLTGFVRQLAAPLAEALGRSWARGEIEIYHEHLCCDMLLRLLYRALAATSPKPDYPRIIFGTPPDELHVLGLLMAQAVLADHGAYCLGAGTQLPIGELQKAARAWRADIVAISFSFAYPTRRIRPLLADLRARLPNATTLWTGGAGAAGIERAPAGVRIFTDLDQPVVALRQRVARRPGRHPEQDRQ